MTISFFEPAIGPQTEDEEQAFTNLEDAIRTGYFSSAAGWAISAVRGLNKSRVAELKKCIQDRFPSRNRNCQNWSVLLIFVEKVLFTL